MPGEDQAVISVRLATTADVPALTELIAASVERLQAGDYSEPQRLGAIGSVFGVDPVLIQDQTYFVAVRNSEICGCGGWSRRATPFGTDHSPARDDRMLDPRQDAARIRALFVHPTCARIGVGSAVLKACETAAQAAGFQRAELTATLTGVKLFRVHGFVPAEELQIPLKNGETLPVLRMTKALA
jgi:N-acetylglutamate synthase-like GNAT family acetyltransferase